MKRVCLCVFMLSETVFHCDWEFPGLPTRSAMHCEVQHARTAHYNRPVCSGSRTGDMIISFAATFGLSN